jgi:uncharacterized membrane protein YdjX (TVP38/TMEM64 family)
VTARGRIRIFAAALGALALIVAGKSLPFGDWLADFGGWIAGLGALGVLLYAAAHAGVTVLMLPAVLMTIGAGFLFGLLPGTAVALAGATAGCSSSFLIARHLARERVARAAARDPRFAALDAAIGEKGWRIVFLLRMSAVVPFVLSNYVYGLTAIRFWPYVAASATGMIPLTFLYVALGAAARAAGRLETSASPPGAWAAAVFGAGVLITAAVTVYVARLTRKALAARE